jgi:8-oxo-dGTP diphosphatase
MTGGNYLAPADWFATLPSVIMAAGALITDPGGHVLLVKPNYRDHWAVPGGICEQGEPPHEGCARELLEELGLMIPVGRLLVVNWSAPNSERLKSIMHFFFDGATLRDGSEIRLQREELDDFRFVEPDDVTSFLPPYGAPRVIAALRARAEGTAVYLPSGRPYPVVQP